MNKKILSLALVFLSLAVGLLLKSKYNNQKGIDMKLFNIFSKGKSNIKLDIQLDTKKIIPIVKIILDSESTSSNEELNLDMVLKKAAGDLSFFYGLEEESQYILLQHENLPGDLTIEKLHQFAQENLWKKVEPNLEMHKTHFGGVGLSCGFDLEASLIALPQVWEILSQALGEEIVFIVPSKDLPMYASAKDENVVEKFKEAIEKVRENYEDDQRMLLSKQVFKYKDGQITIVE